VVWQSHVLAERAHGIYNCGHRWIVCSLDARSLSLPDRLKLKRIEKRGVLAGRAQSEAARPPARGTAEGPSGAGVPVGLSIQRVI